MKLSDFKGSARNVEDMVHRVDVPPLNSRFWLREHAELALLTQALLREAPWALPMTLFIFWKGEAGVRIVLKDDAT